MKAPIPDISQDLFDLTGYCSIVTGASLGIGLNIAEALAYKGSDFVLVSRNAERLEEAAGKVRAIGRRAVAVAADVADDDAPERIVEAALGLGGRIDVLVNNAGFMTFADPFNVNDETWDEIFNVNVRAPMRITRAVLAEMVKACRGSIINIGSSWSTRASVFNQDGGGVDYCSSKAALHALTRATAQDVAPKNIRVNTIAPGAVDTPMHADHRALLFEFEKYIPLGRIQVAEDLAGAVIFLPRMPVLTSPARPSMSMGVCLWRIRKDFAGRNWTQTGCLCSLSVPGARAPGCLEWTIFRLQAALQLAQRDSAILAKFALG